jgi:hypothetical protein
MDLDKIKDQKIQEANELFKRLGIDTNNEPNFENGNSPCYQTDTDESEGSKIEFHWTRLSNNSNIGCITD